MTLSIVVPGVEISKRPLFLVQPRFVPVGLIKGVEWKLGWRKGYNPRLGGGWLTMFSSPAVAQARNDRFLNHAAEPYPMSQIDPTKIAIMAQHMTAEQLNAVLIEAERLASTPVTDKSVAVQEPFFPHGTSAIKATNIEHTVAVPKKQHEIPDKFDATATPIIYLVSSESGKTYLIDTSRGRMPSGNYWYMSKSPKVLSSSKDEPNGKPAFRWAKTVAVMNAGDLKKFKKHFKELGVEISIGERRQPGRY